MVELSTYSPYLTQENRKDGTGFPQLHIQKNCSGPSGIQAQDIFHAIPHGYSALERHLSLLTNYFWYSSYGYVHFSKFYQVKNSMSTDILPYNSLWFHRCVDAIFSLVFIAVNDSSRDRILRFKKWPWCSFMLSTGLTQSLPRSAVLVKWINFPLLQYLFKSKLEQSLDNTEISVYNFWAKIKYVVSSHNLCTFPCCPIILFYLWSSHQLPTACLFLCC